MSTDPAFVQPVTRTINTCIRNDIIYNGLKITMESPEYVCDPACPRKESPDHTSRLASPPARPAATTAGCPGGSVERRCLPTAAGPVSSQTGKTVPIVLKMSAQPFLSHFYNTWPSSVISWSELPQRAVGVNLKNQWTDMAHAIASVGL